MVHRNLAVYFLLGASRPGPTPLTLQEALEKAKIRLTETGRVNELRIENVGDEEVFLHAGDIVKGGWQDRTLSVSLILQPHSGEIPIASFCVEARRWAARSKEDASSFAASSRAVPSREMKLAMHEALRRPTEPEARHQVSQQDKSRPGIAVSETSVRQRRIWDGVRLTQEKLTRNLGQAVEARASVTSLELSLDNDELHKAITGYSEILLPAGEKQDDIVGTVFAINGRISIADLYPSNGLFRKMWKKQLHAGTIEAIGEQDATALPTPAVRDVEAFLAGRNTTVVSERDIAGETQILTRESDQILVVEAHNPAAFVHRTYLAKW
ncbi:MAG: hypothetical protein FWD68_03165 [Alphaproteobacteria bacterium]|nr:hypothetical protein [Alphaproteobacteria bacterium]